MKQLLLCVLCVITINIQAQSNFALNFSGTGQYVSIGAPIASSSSYTKEAWVFLSSATGPRNIISSQNAPLWVDNGILKAGQAGTQNYVVDPSAFPLNTWVHVAVSYDNSSMTMRLYRDGIEVDSRTSVPVYTTEATFIGSFFGSSNYWSGRIDEVCIWNRLLSDVEIKAMAFKGPAVDAPGLLAYYKMNEGSGTALTNVSSGSGTNGLITGATWVNSPVQYGANAVSFDGTNDYINLGSSTTLKPATNLTQELWVKSPNWNVSSQQQITSCYESGGYGLTLNGGNLNFLLGITGIPSYIGVSYPQTSLTNNQWYHIAGTFDGRYIRMYINGELVGTNDLGPGHTIRYTYPNNNLLIGAEATTSTGTDGMYFLGEIDEVRIWNVVRNQAEIQANMNNGLDPSAPEQAGLVSYYTFNQGLADGSNPALTRVLDQKGVNTAIINNFALSGTSSNYVAQRAQLIELPITWNEFDARAENSSVILQWSTIQEFNSLDFTVQRSHDSRSWTNIGVVSAAGQSSNTRYYSFIDKAPTVGLNYYRLLQRDMDHRSSFSKVKRIDFIENSKALDIQGNIVSNGVLQLKANTSVTIFLFTSDGKLMLKRHLLKGNHTISAGHLPKGIYMLSAGGITGRVIIK